jgi:hypothetical protein
VVAVEIGLADVRTLGAGDVGKAGAVVADAIRLRGR